MPIGLGMVRIGNFLNGELYGRPTDGTWGFIFPTDPYGYTRHPSQLYEAFLRAYFSLFYLGLMLLKIINMGLSVAVSCWPMVQLDFY